LIIKNERLRKHKGKTMINTTFLPLNNSQECAKLGTINLTKQMLYLYFLTNRLDKY